MRLSFVFILIVCFVSCEQNSDVNNVIAKDKNYIISSKSNNNKLNLLKESLKDSINQNTLFKHKELYKFVIDSVFNYESIDSNFNYFNYYPLKDIINISLFNDNYLVKIKYEDGSKLYYSYYAALINNEQQILESDFIEGCKYHNGTLRIEDWNNDGIQNIIYNIDYPTSSVPYIEKMESVYTLDTQNGLSEVFSIALETRDCTSDSEYGGSITKKSYRFINKKKIKVKITKSSFNCDNFKFHGKIQNITKQTLGVYYMSWNKDQNKFTDFTDR